MRRELAAAALAFAAAAPAPARAPTWMKGELPGVRLYTDAPIEKVTDFAVRYSAFRQCYDLLLAGPERHTPPVALIAFASAASLPKYGGETPEAPNQSLGALIAVADGTPIIGVALGRSQDDALRSAIESTGETLLSELGYFCPKWMGQGTAEVFASIKMQKNTCRIGTPESRLTRPFRGEQWIPPGRFFVAHPNTTDYTGDEEFTGIYQAQSWFVMHAVLISATVSESRRRFQELAAQVRGTPADEYPLSRILGIDPTEFEKQLQSKPYSTVMDVPVDPGRVRASLKVSAAPPVELHVALADLAGGRDNLTADIEIDQARAAAPQAPEIKEALARQAIRRGDRSGAIILYREAIEAGSKDPQAYLMSAEDRLQSLQTEGREIAGTGGEMVTDAISEINRCITLSPGNGAAYYLLANALFLSPEVTEADIAALQPAVADTRFGPALEYLSGVLHLRARQPAKARIDFQTVMRDPRATPKQRDMADRQLSRLLTVP